MLQHPPRHPCISLACLCSGSETTELHAVRHAQPAQGCPHGPCRHKTSHDCSIPPTRHNTTVPSHPQNITRLVHPTHKTSHDWRCKRPHHTTFHLWQPGGCSNRLRRCPLPAASTAAHLLGTPFGSIRQQPSVFCFRTFCPLDLHLFNPLHASCSGVAWEPTDLTRSPSSW